MCVNCRNNMINAGFPEFLADLIYPENAEQPVAEPVTPPDTSQYLRRLECLKLAASTPFADNTRTAEIIKRGAAFYNYCIRGETNDSA